MGLNGGQNKDRLLQTGLALAVPASFLLSLLIGRYDIPVETLIKMLLSTVLPIEKTWPQTMETVFFQIRLPRITAAFFVGGSLAVSGAIFQGIFKNPLVSPDILGVSYGAGFGAALAILLTNGGLYLQASAIFFGLTAVCAAYAMARLFKGAPVLVLVLSGIIVGAFFHALLSSLKYIADPYDKLPSIIFWLMGSLSRVAPEDLKWSVPAFITGITALYACRWRVNLLALGDEEARSLGVNTTVERGVVIFICTLLSCLAVCLAGTIGWVGLVIPHVGRLFVGSDYRKLIPVSVSLGGIYLILIDNAARALTANEIPLGILTSLIGAPFFALLLIKRRAGWQA
ncbi:MAG: iron ABC transporter permease [Cloacibacillus sp.]